MCCLGVECPAARVIGVRDGGGIICMFEKRIAHRMQRMPLGKAISASAQAMCAMSRRIRRKAERGTGS